MLHWQLILVLTSAFTAQFWLHFSLFCCLLPAYPVCLPFKESAISLTAQTPTPDMPQVDKTTFLSIATWTVFAYLFGYLALNTTVLYSFLTALKITLTRFATALMTGMSNFLSLKPAAGFSAVAV